MLESYGRHDERLASQFGFSGDSRRQKPLQIALVPWWRPDGAALWEAENRDGRGGWPQWRNLLRSRL